MEVRVYLDQIGKVTEDGQQHALTLDSTERKLVDVEKELQSLKVCLEAVQKEAEQCKHRITDLQVELKNERFGKKRLEEELAVLNTKYTCLCSLNDGETVVGRLQEEIKEYKAILKFSVFHDRPKEVVITKCFHLFCGPCIQRNLETQHRKCPGCGTGFGQNDVQTVYI